MIRIQSVNIENFQSHKNSKMDFDSGLNVIIGPSDQGKSAVIRAIKWVLFNEPRGLEFLRHGETTAKVSIEFSNGYTIVRERSKSKNRYTVIDASGASTVFEGFGNEVPEEVIKAHGIPRVVLDTDISSALNISDQLEGPFLLSETGAVRAKAIGRLTGIHIIDNSIRDCLADLRRENQTRERISKEIVEIDKSLELYSDLDNIGQNLDRMEALIKHTEASFDRMKGLEEKKSSYDACVIEYSDVLKKLDLLNQIKDYEYQVKSIEACIEKFKNLSRIRSGIKDIEAGIASGNDMLGWTSKNNEVSGLIEEISDKNNKVKRYSILGESLRKLGLEIKRETSIINATETLDGIIEITNLLKAKTERIHKIAGLNDKLNDWDSAYKELEKSIERLDTIGQHESVLKDAAEKITVVKKLEDLLQKYTLLSSQIQEGNKYMNQNLLDLKNMTKEYVEKLKALGKCPLCDSKLDENKLTDIIKHYEEVH